MIRNDNKKYKIAVANEISNGYPGNLCREEIQVNKNKFCVKLCRADVEGYGATHRNGDKPKITVDGTSILAVIPGKNMAFIQPMGSAEHVSEHDLEAWKEQEHTLADWNHLFFLAEAGNSTKTGNPEEIKALEDFSAKASLHKTPGKNRSIRMSKEKHVPMFLENSKKKLIEAHKLEKGKFSYKTMECMAKLENQVVALENELSDLMKVTDRMSSEIIYELKVLEMEKNKMKVELGSRSKVIIGEEFDDPTVWGTMALLEEA